MNKPSDKKPYPSFADNLQRRFSGEGSDGWSEELAQVLHSLDQDNEAIEPYLDKPLKDHYDVIVIGSGPGGGTMAYELAKTGKSVLLVERGDILPTEPENWNSDYVLKEQKYANSEKWLDAEGNSYQPNMYYYVGGLTKFYAGTLVRFHPQDFEKTTMKEGCSPAWPVSYAEMEPYYSAAERLYLCHGAADDVYAGERSGSFPYPPVPVVPEIATIREAFEKQGLKPYTMPQGLSLYSGQRCLFCAYCDSYPCRVLAKGEPETVCIRPAIKRSNVTLLRNAKAEKLITDATGDKIVEVEVSTAEGKKTLSGDLFVLAAGAVNSPVLLLNSKSDKHPNGLVNSSDQVGRNYMRNLTTMLLAKNAAGEALPQNHFWKSLGLNDWYKEGVKEFPWPMGTIQITGNYHGFMDQMMPDSISEEERKKIMNKMIPFFVISEDLPDPGNRVMVTEDNQIQVRYKPNNLDANQALANQLSKHLEKAKFGLQTRKSFNELTDGGGYHHNGTLRMGNDPKTSVVDKYCKAHDLDNLYVVDASCFASGPALNPVLTIVANSLRVADHIKSL